MLLAKVNPTTNNLTAIYTILCKELYVSIGFEIIPCVS